MKRFTILLTVILALAIAVAPAFAGKGTIVKDDKVFSRNVKTSAPLGVQRPVERPDEVRASDAELSRQLLPAVKKVTMGKVAGLAGLYSIGTLAPGGYVANYTTLSEAVNALNTNGVDDAVTFEFTDAAYTDTGVTITGTYPNAGAFPVTFQLAPSNPSAVITFENGLSGSANTWGVYFNGAKNVTWQGTTTAWTPGFADRPLQLVADTTGRRRNCIVISNGCNGITLKDMRLTGWRKQTGTLGGFAALFAFNAAATAADSNVSIYNLKLERSSNGLNMGGPNGALRDYNWTIQGCEVGGTFYGDGCTQGIQVSNCNNIYIRDNEINGVFTGKTTNDGVTPSGINLSFGNMTNLYVERNKVHNLERGANSVGAAYGILCAPTSGVLDNTRMFNNMVYDLRNVSARLLYQAVWGIVFWGSTSTPLMGNVRCYNNTIALDSSLIPAATGWSSGAFLNAFHASDFVRFANNIVYNTTVTPGGGGGYALYTTTTIYLEDNNVYFAGGDMSLSNAGSLTDLRNALGQDGASVDGDPYIVSNYDPHIKTDTGLVSSAEALAFPLPYITTDIDGEPRDLSTPDAGADEFTPIPWPHDAKPVALELPGIAGIPEGKNDIFPSLSVRNNGDNTDDIPVRIIVKQGATEFWNATYTATGVPRLTTINLSEEFGVMPAFAVGSYDVLVITELSTDNDLTNDTLFSTTVVVNKYVGDYSTDFEDGGIGWVTASVGGAANDWVLGDPEKTFIDTAASGVNAWVTKLTGNYSNSHNGAVYSPFFDLSNMTRPVIKFKHMFDTEQEWDGGGIEYSTDYGFTWTLLGDLNDRYHWYNSPEPTTAIYPSFDGKSSTVFHAGYVFSAHDATAVAGQAQVRFRFRFASDSNTNFEGWAFDDFSIQEGDVVSGTVYHDDNGNGTQDEGEPGIEGDTVMVTGAEDVTTTTDTNGDYSITLFVEGNYVASSISAGTNTQPGGAGTYNFSYVKGTGLDADFGWYNPASVSGNIWHDMNGNQTEDVGEGKLDSVLVTIGNYSAYSNASGNYTVFVEEPGTYEMSASKDGYTTLFPKTPYSVTVTYGDVVTGKNYGLAGTAFAKKFRTATYNDWATAVDGKGKLKAIKCKPDKVEFKFRIQAPAAATSVLVKIGQVSSGSVTDTAKGVTYTTWTDAKEVTYTGSIDSAQWIQLEGWGTKGKAIKAKATWFRASDGKKVKTDPVYILNNPRLPMPNLHNVAAELSYPIVIGNASGGGSVSHASSKAVLKSMNSKGTLHSANVTCLDMTVKGKPMSKQLKALDPVKTQNNIFFAEVLTLGMNLAASAAGKFPSGLDTLIVEEPGMFNEMSVAQIYAEANKALGCTDTNYAGDTTGKIDSLYAMVKRINEAFAGTIDTVSWSCTSLELTGVKDIKNDVTWLRANPGTIPLKTTPKPFSGTYEPVQYALQQNYPNPFNPTTTIAYDLVDDAIVTLKIYNMLGQEIATLIDNELVEAGENEVEFDAAGMPSGVYFYRLNIQPLDEDGVAMPAITQVKKMMLLK